MLYRRLGPSGPEVSEVGFGAWGIGGATPGETSYGTTDDAVSVAALHRALDRGITFFDTAPAYGYGHSETLLGGLLRGRRDRIVVATKAGVTRYDQAADFRPAVIAESLEDSLRRLGTDHVDLLQLHNAPVELLRREPAILDTLAGLRQAGKLRAWGLSVRAPAEGAIAIAELGAAVVQCNFNMLDVRAVESGLFDAAARHGAGIIARTPLCFGFLSGTVDATTRFAPGDHRNAWPRPQIERWAAGAAAVFSRLTLGPGETRGQAALRFCLSYAQVSTVIPGMLTPDEVDENAASSALGPLPAELTAWIEASGRDERLVATGGVRPA